LQKRAVEFLFYVFHVLKLKLKITFDCYRAEKGV